MHNAPSVSYPVGRCAFQCTLYAGLTVLTSAVLWAWALHSGVTLVWSVAAGAAMVGLCLGWQALRQVGCLIWDGETWSLHALSATGEGVLGAVHVVLDVQKALLLRWQPTSDTLNAKPQWLWLGAQAPDDSWQNLRRAVYQRIDL